MSSLILGALVGFAAGVFYSVRASERDTVAWTLFKSIFGTKKG